MNDKEELYKSWSLKNVRYPVIVAVKQLALTCAITQPEALDTIVSFYQQFADEDAYDQI